jgi:hypothetical protein
MYIHGVNLGFVTSLSCVPWVYNLLGVQQWCFMVDEIVAWDRRTTARGGSVGNFSCAQ